MITSMEMPSSLTYAQFCCAAHKSALQNATYILQHAFDMSETQARRFLEVSRIDADKMLTIFHSIQIRDIEQILEPVEIQEQSKLAIGTRIGSGHYGVVYTHLEDNNRVIKRIKRVGYLPYDSGSCSVIGSSKGSLSPSQKVEGDLTIEKRLQSAIEEARLFCRYYGNGTARVIVSEGDVYIEMKKISGQRVKDIDYGGFEPDAIERFWDMLFRLDHLGIWHNDISLNNILYDGETNTFYPVDISNLMCASSSFALFEDMVEDATLNVLEDIENIIEYIQEKSP